MPPAPYHISADSKTRVKMTGTKMSFLSRTRTLTTMAWAQAVHDRNGCSGTFRTPRSGARSGNVPNAPLRAFLQASACLTVDIAITPAMDPEGNTKSIYASSAIRSRGVVSTRDRLRSPAAPSPPPPRRPTQSPRPA
eukprot:3917781-Prymnesium_polylepis.1